MENYTSNKIIRCLYGAALILLLALAFVLPSMAYAEDEGSRDTEDLLICSYMDPQVLLERESRRILSELSLKEKVCQLFVVRPEALGGGATVFSAPSQSGAEEYPAGGYILFNANIKNSSQLKTLTGALRDAFRIPAIISVDEEGGSVVRLANTKALGIKNIGNMGAVGATKDTLKAYQAGLYIGRYIREYGFNMDFAPDADINTNPKNKVIGNRAFGSDPQLVSSMVSSAIDGFHRSNVGAVIKHFPGHGDTSADTHSGYVAVNKSWEELLEAELVPFIDNLSKTDAVMAAHITMKKVTDDGLPASLSKELLTGKLREELGYDGLIITDSLEMGAIKKNYGAEEAVIMAIEAGNDLLLMPVDYKKAVDAVLKALEEGRISEERIDESVLRILKYKLKYCY